MKIKTIELAQNGSEPEVMVFIGQAQYGEYEVTLKCPATGQRKLQAEGDNVETWDDKCRLKVPLAHLDGCVLSWWITIAAPASGPGQFYFARVTVTQDGHEVCEPFEYNGPLENTKNIVDVARFHVA